MEQIKRQYIRRIGFSLVGLSILVTALAVANWAQQPTALSSRSVYYDTFNERWLNPTKWLTGLDCGPLTLECVREIQNGQLRLAVRQFGATNSDSGFQFADSALYFSNPNAINSITTDITMHSFSGTSCSTNTGDITRTPTSVGGVYFNTGSGQQADDVGDMVFFVVDTNNPKTISVTNWMSGSGLGVSTDMGSYPVGTTFTATIAWDKANHQFISAVKVKEDPSQSVRVTVPYYVSDTKPATWTQRSLNAALDTPNCTSAQTFGQVEVFYDNVMINVPLPAAN
jgi:hypothetical protein